MDFILRVLCVPKAKTPILVLSLFPGHFALHFGRKSRRLGVSRGGLRKESVLKHNFSNKSFFGISRSNRAASLGLREQFSDFFSACSVGMKFEAASLSALRLILSVAGNSHMQP